MSTSYRAIARALSTPPPNPCCPQRVGPQPCPPGFEMVRGVCLKIPVVSVCHCTATQRQGNDMPNGDVTCRNEDRSWIALSRLGDCEPYDLPRTGPPPAPPLGIPPGDFPQLLIDLSVLAPNPTDTFEDRLSAVLRRFRLASDSATFLAVLWALRDFKVPTIGFPGAGSYLLGINPSGAGYGDYPTYLGESI